MAKCPYCGRANADSVERCAECGARLIPFSEPGEVSNEVVPPLPPPTLIRREEVETAFKLVEGFHRADWVEIRRWIGAHIPSEDRNAAFNEAVRLWLTLLRDDFGGSYGVLESRRTLLLCGQPVATARRVLKAADRVSMSIEDLLGTTAWRGDRSKHVILAISELDDYYQYLAFYLPDGEHPMSAGVCIHSGLTHTALVWNDDFNEVRGTVTHELTHDSLAHLPLPLWLNEGIAMLVDWAVQVPPPGISGGWRPPLMWSELAEQHFDFWNEQNIQSFWAGTSFFATDGASGLSYTLAPVLLKLLSEHATGTQFNRFVEAAHRDDAGQTAALNILNTDLGELAGTFLGKGNWRPQRKAMVMCWEAAGWTKSGDQR